MIGRSTWFQKSKQPEKEQLKMGTGRQNHSEELSDHQEPVDRKEDKPESVLFVPHTPYGELKKIMQGVDRELTKVLKYGQNKVVERLGDSLERALCNRAPWRTEPCTRSSCTPCLSKPGSCRQHNVTYSITCNLCAKEGSRVAYWGETRRSWWDRSG